MEDSFVRLGIAAEMAGLERYIAGLVDSPVLLLAEPGRYILGAGGKRLRAALTLLAARANGGPIPETACHAAAAVELIHAASLVHDDLIDQSPHRRGRPTIHEKWNHDAALLAGDYLFALAARELAQTGDVRVIQHIAEAAAAICEGEISTVDRAEPLPEALAAYTFKIGHKTAALFAAAGKVGSLCGGAEEEKSAALGRFGYALGMAFQIVDDVLDYLGDERALGKPAGSDLRRGLITLPLIYAVAHDDADGFLRQVTGRLGGQAGPEELAAALERVRTSAGPQRALLEAERYRQEALAHLPMAVSGPVRASLEEVARLAVERSS